jgi:NADH-quinone oxidoreductase subunit A
MLGQWAALLVYAVVAFAIPAGLLFAPYVIGTRAGRPSPNKNIPFESGVSSRTFRAGRFTVSYYLTAMLFIVFDIEIVFLYPLALRVHDLGTFALAEMGVFVLLLLVAYVYIWRKGALEWQ